MGVAGHGGEMRMRRVEYWHDKEHLIRSKRKCYIKTVEEYNALATAIRTDSMWFDKFMVIVAHYYKQEPTGGQLHIVLDDGNLEETHIAWCAGLAHGVQDHEAADIANLMRFMNMEQKELVYNNTWGDEMK